DERSLKAAVLVLFFVDRLKQNKIAPLLKLSNRRVNEIIQEARRDKKLVAYTLKLPRDKQLGGRLHLLFPKEVYKPNAVVLPLDELPDINSRLNAVGVAG